MKIEQEILGELRTMNDNAEDWRYSGGGLKQLSLIFAVLKLTEQIGWSWWFVCLPAIIGFVIPPLMDSVRSERKKRERADT